MPRPQRYSRTVRIRATLPTSNRWLWSTLAFVLSLVCLRAQITLDLKLPWEQAFELGLIRGWMLDIAAALIPVVLSYLFYGVFRLPIKITWVLTTLAVWGGSYANATYFRFFESRLHWWIVQYYIGDVLGSRESVGSLSFTKPMLASLACLAVSIFLVLFLRSESKKLKQPRAAMRALGTGLLAGILLLVVQVRSATTHQDVSVVSNQVFRIWWENFKKSRRPSPLVRPDQTLADYRRWGTNSPTNLNATLDLKHPLWHRLDPQPAVTTRLRHVLGLPIDKPVNVVLVFVESFRTLEFLHSDFGPKIFPGLKKLAKRHGMLFTQAYTSAGIAGMTARGQFSTVCSMIPTLDGPAPYMTHPELGVRCLPELLDNAGYETLWFHSLDRNYHNTAAFESHHGTKTFFDREYYVSRGLQPEGAAQGIKDGPFLRETLSKMIEVARSGHPIYANLLTYSTHHPFVAIPEGKLPESVASLAASSPEYTGYLSKFHYADQALSEFVRDLFSSPIGDDTLVVVLGDHGVNVPSTLNLNEVQVHELRYRIPLLFLTKNLPRPRAWHHVVHQVDIAPTIAAVLGLHGWVTWLGHDILSGGGSPFLTRVETGVAYRTAREVCYPDIRDGSMRCWETSGGLDPLMDADLPRSKEDPEKTRFFESLAQASSLVIRADWFKKAKPDGSATNARQ